MACEVVDVIMTQPKQHPQWHRYDQHDQLPGDALQPSQSEPTSQMRPRKQDEQTQGPHAGYRGVESRDGFWQLSKDFKRLARRLLPDGNRQLFEHNDDADCCEHPVHHGRWEEVTQHTCTQETEQHLHDAGDDADRQCHPIRAHVRNGVLACRVSKSLHGSQHDHNEPRCRALDSEFRITDERCDKSTHDSREHTRDRRKTGRHRDAQTEREGDQEYEESRCGILSQIPDEPRCITARNLRIYREQRSTPSLSTPRMSHALQIPHKKNAREV